jgi:hypothetical protein
MTKAALAAPGNSANLAPSGGLIGGLRKFLLRRVERYAAFCGPVNENSHRTAIKSFALSITKDRLLGNSTAGK